MKPDDAEAGVTVVKTITELRFICPYCKTKVTIMQPDPFELLSLFQGTMSIQCDACKNIVGLYPEDEI